MTEQIFDDRLRGFSHPSAHPSICPSVHIPFCPSVNPSICPSVHLTIRPSAHPPIRPSAHLPICPSVHLPTRPSAHPSICLPVPLPTRLSGHQSICPSALTSIRPSFVHRVNFSSIRASSLRTSDEEINLISVSDFPHRSEVEVMALPPLLW